MALRESDTLYGVSRFGSASYGEEVAIWSVPEIGGRDEVGRLLVVEDANSDTATMAYDIDGRCTQIGHNNGLSDLMSFDIVGKLLSKRVQGSETLMEMHYGYSLAGDRIAQQTDLDTFTYLADAAGRLVEESHNRFCIDHPNIWKQGQWEFLEFDEETRSLQLASLNDDFSGNALDLQRWTLEGRQNGRSDDVLGELDAVGLELRQNEGLQVAYPRAFSNQSVLHRAPVDNSIGVDAQNYPTPGNGYPEALGPKPLWLDMRHNQKLVGDFDIAIDYQNFLGGGGYEFDVQLAVSPTTLTPDFSETWLAVRLTAEGSSRYLWFTKTDSTITSPVPGINFTGYHYGPPAQGQMRLKRTGSTYQGFYRAQGASSWTSMSTLSGPTDDLNLYLSFANYRHSACVRLTNFQFLSGDSRASEGLFVSGIYDAGRVVSWDSLRWTEDLPSGCDVELEVCVADDYAEFENFATPPAFFGPTGGGNFTTPAGQALPTGKTGRYAMVRATLTGNGTDTPTLSDIQLTCNANSDNGSRVLRYRYDNAGNITRITTVDDSGVKLDVRDDENWAPEERINSLNQIIRQDTGHVNWRFIWDDNGNLTRKSCGAETFTYVWNVENRLLQVTKEVTVGGWGAARFHEGTFHQTPSTFTEWVVNYTYDSAGRMITRDDNNGNVTTFLWDGWQMIRETTGESVTTYCIPEGHLLSFIRDGARFDCHTDALASVRLVTDEEGAVVSRFDTGAYGELLAGSFDGVPGGMPYTWVGGLGVRRIADGSVLHAAQVV
jgi:YD repeat-containing protein